jgi:hypothetical protein
MGACDSTLGEVPTPSCRTSQQTSYARNHDSCGIEDRIMSYNDGKLIFEKCVRIARERQACADK